MAKKRKRTKKILIFLTAALIVLSLVFIYGYIDFVFQKIGETGLTPLSDWRSYVASILNRIPLVNQFVQYEPRKVIPQGQYYQEIYEVYIERIDKDRTDLEEKARELGEIESSLTSRERQLDARQQEIAMREERLNTEIAAKESIDARLNQLADWFNNADERLIAPALADPAISVEEIVGGLRRVDPGIAADIIAQLAQVNPQKAANILALMAGKEVTR
jgi:DNA repair exonuclease SbcCD ATPase subunit